MRAILMSEEPYTTGTKRGTGQKRSQLRWISDLLQVAVLLWPRKTAAHLAGATNASVRSAEFWLAGKYDISLPHARELLRSEEGWPFFVALMGDCRAKWWMRVKLREETYLLRKSIEAQRYYLSAPMPEIKIYRESGVANAPKRLS